MFRAGPGILPWLILAALGCTTAGPQVGRTQVSIAAASDLKFALDEVLGDFRKNHPTVDVRVVYGSSGNFYAQLQNRAPFDVYLSADVAYPQKLIEQGLALPNSGFTYGFGKLVLWTRTP
ncbi:MAG: molybdate ABC transporter substrate-binding protein, partial [Acidimicrobiia bacterium]